MRALGEGAYDDEYEGEEKEGDEAEKQPLTGGSVKGASAPAAGPSGAAQQGSGADNGELAPGGPDKAAEPILQNA